MKETSGDGLRVLVVAPVGRDSELAAQTISEGGLHCHVCQDVDELAAYLQAEAGAIVATEEALSTPVLHVLSQHLSEQPSWSDLPVVLLLSRNSHAADVLHRFHALDPGSNVTVLERPVRAATLISVLQSAVHARRRQYEVRDLLERLEQEQRALRASEQALHQRLVELQTLYATTPIGLAFLDPHLRYVSINRYLARLNGQPVEDHLGRRVRDVLPAEAADLLEPVCRQVLETGRPITYVEYRHAPPEQEERYYLASFYPAREDDEAILGVTAVVQDVTERKQADAALRQSRQDLQTLADNVPAIISRFGPDLRHVFVNRAITQTTGLAPEDFLGKTSREVGMPPELCDRWDASLRTVFATGKKLENHFAFTGPEGRREFESEIIPEFGPTGEVRYALSVVRDVTERKKTEAERERLMAELAEERARLSAILSRLPAGVIVAEAPSGRILMGNDYARSFFGDRWHDSEGIEEYGWWKGYHPDDTAFSLAETPMALALKGQTITGVEIKFPHDEGGWLWVTANAAPLRNAEGEIIAGILAFADITPIRKAEEALRESEARFRQLADAMPQLVWTANPDGTIDYYNQRWQEFSGFERVEENRWIWGAAVHPNDQARTVAAWERAVQTGEVYEIEHRVALADGSYRWFLSRSAPIRDAAGQIVKWYGTATDIHDQKQTQQELAHLNETLEQQVDARTHQVRRLASALTLAEQEERRRVSQLLHDHLQQLLFGLQLKLHALHRDGLSTEQRTNVARMQEILEEAMSTTRSLTVELNPPVLREAGFRAGLEWLTGHMHATHGLRIELRCPELPPINQELRSVLFQFVRELLFNVVKHADVEQARLSVRLRENTLRITVMDSGRGFDPEEAFVSDGNHYGLSSIRERLQMLGGDLVAEAASGKGAKVTLVIPL